MFKDYYHILGLSKDATERDIKRSFRSLAMVYHPDSNEDPEAHQKFLDINEAYQTLGDPIKRKQYDGQYDYHLFIKHSETVRHSYSTTYSPPVYDAPRRPSRFEEFSRYNFFSRFVAWLGLLFAFSIVADYLFAQYSEIEEVRSMTITQGPGGELSGFLRTDSLSFILDYTHFDNLGKGDFVSLRKTPFYQVVTHLYVWEFPETSERTMVQHVPRSYTPERMIQVYSIFPHYGIYNVFSFFLIALLVSSMVGVTLQDRPEFLFKLGMLTVLLSCISVFILINS